MQCPLTLVLACTLMVPDGRIVTFCVVQTRPLTSSTRNFCTSTGSFLWEEHFCFLPSLPLVWAAMGELQWPQHDYSKVSLSPCCGGFCKLPCSHETQNFVNYLSTHHDQNHLGVGRGGDNQQQHILIVISDPWNLKVSLYKSKVWDGCTTCPL